MTNKMMNSKDKLKKTEVTNDSPHTNAGESVPYRPLNAGEVAPSSSNDEALENQEYNKKLEEQAEYVNKKTSQMESFLTNIKKEIFSDENIAALMRFSEKTGKVRDDLGWLSFVLAFVILALNLLRLIATITNEKLDRATRGVQIAATIGGFALGILSVVIGAGLLVIATPIMIIVGASKGLAEQFYGIGKAIYDRFIGQGRKDQSAIRALEEKVKNQSATENEKINYDKLRDTQHARNATILTKVNAIFQNAAGLTGGILLLSPFAAIAYPLLAVTALYGILDIFEVSPFKLIGKGMDKISEKLRGKPFFTSLNPVTKKERYSPELTPLLSDNEILARRADAEGTLEMSLPIAPVTTTTAELFKHFSDKNDITIETLKKINAIDQVIKESKSAQFAKTATSNQYYQKFRLNNPTQTTTDKTDLIDFSQDAPQNKTDAQVKSRSSSTSSTNSNNGIEMQDLDEKDISQNESNNNEEASTTNKLGKS